MKQEQNVVKFNENYFFNFEYLDSAQKKYHENKKLETTIYCRISFDGLINLSIFKQAVANLLHLAPILACKIAKRKNHLIWVLQQKVEIDEIVKKVETRNYFNKCFDKVLSDNEYPILFYYYAEAKKSELLVCWNHLVGDGASFIQTIRSVVALYNLILNNKPAVLSYRLDASRSPIHIWKQLPLLTKIQNIFKLPVKIHKFKLPSIYKTKTGSLVIRYAQKIEGLLFSKIVNVAHQDSLFSLITNAYMRALFKKLGHAHSINILCAKSVRDLKNINTISNATAMFPIYCKNLSLAKNFKVSLKKIKKQINRNQWIAYRRFHWLFKFYSNIKQVLNVDNWFYDKKITGTLYSISFMPTINNTEIKFGETSATYHVTDSAIKFKPNFQLVITKTENEIILSTLFYGNKNDLKEVKQLFNLIIEELNDYLQEVPKKV